MDWIEPESFRLFCPESADEFVWCEALQGLEASREIIGGDEIRQMPFELLMTVVVIAFDGIVKVTIVLRSQAQHDRRGSRL
jgi:hypothetical protein